MIKAEAEELEEDTKMLFAERREDIKNLVVKNLKSQLARKMEAIKEPPQNILKRFESYQTKDSSMQNSKKPSN